MRRLFVAYMGLMLGLAGILGRSSAQTSSPRPLPQPAFRADQFTNFVGINGSPVKYHVIESGPYAGAGRTYDPALFHALGIRYYRVSLKDDLTPEDQVRQIGEAWKQYGEKPMFLLSPGKMKGIPEILSLVKSYPPGCVEEIEGPNEVNNKFPPQELNLRYAGKTDEAAGAAYMDDVYRALKGDPATNSIPVVAYTAIFTDYSLAKGHSSFDYANMHSYQGYSVPSSSWRMNETRFNNILPPGGHIRPYVPTECGYNVEEDQSNGTNKTGSLQAQARNIPMLMAEYFRHGIRRMYLFALHNADGYGLLESDMKTRRPAYYAVKSLMDAVRDAVWDAQALKWRDGGFSPRALLFTLKGAPDTVHTVTLQKRDGTTLLLIWNEVPNFDESSKRDLDHAPAPVTIVFQSPVEHSATALVRTETGNYETKPVTVKDSSLTLGVPSSVMIVRLRMKPAPAVAAPTAPAELQGTASEDSVSLKWKPSGAAGYFIFRNGAHIATVHASAYRDQSTWIRPALGYTYAVQAYDAAGRMSPRSEALVQTDPRLPDLVVLDVEIPHVEPGAPVRFKSTVKNSGDGATPFDTIVGVSYYVDGQFTSWSTPSNVPLRAGESRVLEADGGPRGTPVWTATPGAHTLGVVIDDIDRIPNERSKQNNVAERTFVVGPASKGLLLGSADPAPGAVDVTAEGTEDWVHWGLTDNGTVNRKDGANLISPLVKVGDGYRDRTAGFGMAVRWSDGTPVKEQDYTHTSLWWNCVGHGYSFTVPADPTIRTLRLYVAGIEGAGCRLEARLSDGSAPDYVSKVFQGNKAFPWAPVPDGFTGVYTLRYRAAGPNQKLTVTWTLDSEPNRFLGQARLQTVTLRRDATQ